MSRAAAAIDGCAGGRRPLGPRFRPRLLVVLACCWLGGSCGPLTHLPVQLLGPPSNDERIVWHGPVGLELRAGEAWLDVRIVNEGDTPIEVAWAEARYYSPDHRAHRLVAGDQLAAYMTERQRAWIEAGWYEPEPTRSTYSDRLPHRAPTTLEPATAGRVAPGRAAEWTLYPAEHIRVDAYGLPTLDALLCGDYVGEQPYFTLVVPVRVDGEWTTVTVSARLSSRPGDEQT